MIIMNASYRKNFTLLMDMGLHMAKIRYNKDAEQRSLDDVVKSVETLSVRFNHDLTFGELREKVIPRVKELAEYDEVSTIEAAAKLRQVFESMITMADDLFP